jgi:selenide,water dikinase
VDPRRVWSNAGARAGDVLVLTKPIGTGVIATAIKFGRAPAAAAAAAMASMAALNRAAAAALASMDEGVHACTDITGFGLAGHATEMAKASGVTFVLDVNAVPLLEGALDLVEGNTPGGGRTNAEYFGAAAAGAALDPRRVQLLYDPQTSGGLLAAIDPGVLARAQAALAEGGVSARVVGVAQSPSHHPCSCAEGCRNTAPNGINLRLACFRPCPPIGLVFTIRF